MAGRGWAWIFTGLALVGCHDARRENPLDPTGIAVPVLAAVLADSTGTVRLKWSRYEGSSAFSHYLILRRAQDLALVDTFRLDDIAMVSHIDTIAPNTPYEYRLALVNEAGLEQVSAVQTVSGFIAGPIQIRSIDVDPATGQAILRWSRFDGPRFGAYRVERRDLEQEDYSLVASLTSIDDLAWTDEDLQPDRRYRYRVVVEAAGTQWVSSPSGSDGFSLQSVDVIAAIGDSAAGVVRIAWQQYRGPDFSEYALSRRQLGTDTERNLAIVSTQTDTAWVDSTALAGVDYEYRVNVGASGERLAGGSRVGRVVLPAVRITSLAFDSPTGSASLSWSAYTGPRFARYEIRRRSVAAADLVAQISDPERTARRDSLLLGNTDYRYEIAVVTTRDEVITTTSEVGGIHRLVAEWPLDMSVDDGVRLYRDGSGVRVVVTTGAGVAVHKYGVGGLLTEGAPLFLGELDGHLTSAPPEAGETPCLSFGDNMMGIRFGCLDASGSLISREQNLFDGLVPDLVGDRPLIGNVALVRVESASIVAYDTVAVTSGGRLLFADGFATGPAEGWTSISNFLTNDNGWQSASRGSANFVLAKIEQPWPEFVASAELLIETGEAGLRVGQARIGFGPQLTLSVNVNDEQVVLTEHRFGSGESTQGFSRNRHVLDIPGLAGVPFGLRLGFEAGRMRAALDAPIRWQSEVSAGQGWASLATVEDAMALAAGDSIYSLTRSGERVGAVSMPGQVSDMRIWTDRARRLWIGVCLPESNEILYGRTAATFRGSVVVPDPESTLRVGGDLGAFPGQMLAPLAFDVTDDGRFVIVDAGNSRVQVFDAEGRYVTTWGSAGSDAGRFNFGGGQSVRDFVGSVAVDAAGYIYVADPGNGRVQVFSP